MENHGKQCLKTHANSMFLRVLLAYKFDVISKNGYVSHTVNYVKLTYIYKRFLRVIYACELWNSVSSRNVCVHQANMLVK